MKVLTIEWRHLDVDGETCERCSDTGSTLDREVRKLNTALLPSGIRIEWFETKLDGDRITESNTVLFDGTSIEDILEIGSSENYCGSCSDLLEKESFCRTIHYDGFEYEDIPAKAIKDAVYKVLDIKRPEEPQMLFF
ncbi:MAG TPA: hypothetical protein DHM90_03945 [Clostridiaceae bacterium]|nr:hypothetical protein [Clostridiaceae bacterium]